MGSKDGEISWRIRGGRGSKNKAKGGCKGRRKIKAEFMYISIPGTTLFVRLFIVTLFETLQLSLCLVFYPFPISCYN